MKRILMIAAAALLLASCGDKYPEHSVVVNSKDALVKTTYGTLCGYIEDGIYTFKGIQYAKAERFMPPQDPDSWEGVQTALYYGNQCPQAPRVTWQDDCEAFLYQWDDGVQSEDCLCLNVWTKGINDGKNFKWEAYDPETKPVVVFNDKTTTVHAGDAFFDEMKSYKRDTWVYRRH